MAQRGNGETTVTKHDVQRKVLELRAEGKSFEDISREMKLDLQTLMDWTRKSQEQVRKGGCGC